MTELRSLLAQSQGVPLTTFFQDGHVSERIRCLIGDRKDIFVHFDDAAARGVAGMKSHACCLGSKVFLGPTVGTIRGPSLAEALHHELVHVAQMDLARRTGRISALLNIEAEAARLANESSARIEIQQGANPDEIYHFWWLLAVAAAAYVLLRPGVANAPGPNDKTYPSVSEGQVAGEAIMLFAVPEASFTVAGRLGLGFYGSMAVAGATSTMGMRAVGDVSSGQFSGVQTYIIDGATGAVIGVIVPGGIRLFRGGAVRSLDWLATQGMRQSDLAISQTIAQRAADSPVTAEELEKIFQGRNTTGRAAEWWMNRRGYVVLWRGQSAPSTTILSPLARSGGVGASEQLVAQMRAAGLADEEIAGYTARWYNQPVPQALAPPGLGGLPLGAAGIPTTRIPGIAANFGEGGVVYLIRLPKSAAIQVPQWGLSVENEWVVLNQLPRGAVVNAIPAMNLPALEVDAMGQLVPGLRGGATGAAGAVDLTLPGRLPELMSPHLPAIGFPPIYTPPAPKKPKLPPNPPGAGTVTKQTMCIRPNSDYMYPVCSTTTTYMVKNGDSLWGLAQKFYGDGKQYTKIYQANRVILGPVAEKPTLRAGQTLIIP